MFDDGYKDNIQFAAPILRKYGVKASFYVVTDCIDYNIPTWTHTLEHLFQFTSRTEIQMDFDFLPEELRVSHLPDEDARLAYAAKLKPRLKKLPHLQRNTLLERIVEAFDDAELPKLMMNWDDLRTLRDEGHYIGSHSVTHAMLGTMEDEAGIRRELEVSGRRIQAELGHFPSTISYPVGSFDHRVKRLAKETGYKIGLAVKQNLHDPRSEDLFEVSRIELYNEPWWKTRLRISNALETAKKIIRYR